MEDHIKKDLEKVLEHLADIHEMSDSDDTARENAYNIAQASRVAHSVIFNLLSERPE